MKKFLALAYIISVTSLSAQIASMEAYVIQEGKDSDYRKIEEFVAPLKAMAIKEGNLMQWIVMKRKSGGDLSSIDKTKEIANYIVFNVYKDKSQMDSDNWNNYRGYASKVYKRKMSKSSINKMFNMAEGNQVKKSWRQYVIQGIYQTPSYRPQIGDLINLDPMEALNEDYENFELEFFMPRWEKVVDEGGLRMWGLAKVLSSSDNAYKNLTHFVFKNPTGLPIKFGENSFLDSKLQEMGIQSRKGFNGASLEIVHIEN
jgi:hypothetical protein